MIFSVLIVFAILLTVGCATAVGHLMLSARESRRQLEARVLAQAMAQEAQNAQAPQAPSAPPVTAPEGLQPRQTQPNSRIVIVTANPSVRFVPVGGSAGTEPILQGTMLGRIGENRWAGASRELDDVEVMRLITGGHAEEVQEDPSNPNVALSASIIGASAEAFHREIQELFANFNRGFMTTRTTTTSRPIPVPTTPPAAAKATPAPAPKSNTPKSAVDRLLEDDILDDDSV